MSEGRALLAAALLEGMPEVAYATDDELRITAANPRFAALVGRERSAVLGQPLGDLLPPHLVGTAVEHEQQVRSIGMPVTREVEVPGRGRSSRMWLVTKFPLRDETGASQGVGTVVADVTEQVRERRAALREATFTREVLDMVPNLIYAKDRSLRFTLANHAMAELLGATPQQLLGCTERELGVSVEQASRSEREDADVFEGRGEIITPEEPRQDAEGQPRWFRTTRRPLLAADSQRAQLLGVATDITEYRNAQHARLQLKEERMEAIGRLAGGIAHDFNNLLTVLSSGAELLRDVLAGDPEFGRVVDDISYASERAAKLTQHLLAYSRRQLLRPQRLELNAVVTEIEGLLGRLLGNEVALSLTLAEELPPLLVDRASLEQILVNLASNARDAMPSGGTLHLMTRLAPGRLPGAERDGIIELIAEDTGEGIPAEVVDSIFEPFFTTKPQGKGTGLGLSTVYGIVRQSGGDIAVEGRPGQGARFVIRLPCAEGGAVVVPVASRRAGDGRGERVLVIDDEAAVLRVVRRILERRGYDVVLAEDLSRAREQAEQYPGAIDLMLIDVVMPGANGFEVASALRGLLPAARVLHMTGHTKDTLPASAGTLTGGYLQKPFTPDQLLEQVRTALDGGVLS